MFSRVGLKGDACFKAMWLLAPKRIHLGTSLEVKTPYFHCEGYAWVWSLVLVRELQDPTCRACSASKKKVFTHPPAPARSSSTQLRWRRQDMIKCAQLCILPSVYKLWMVTKCRQVGAQGGSGGSLGSDFSDWKRP